MKLACCVQRMLLCAVAMCLMLPAARAGDAAPGTIVGLVTDAAKVPVAHATVTAVRADGGAIRATVSASDGVYAFADLPPGAWVVTSQLDDSSQVTTPALTVVSGKATRYDIVMNRASAPGAPAAATAPALAAITPTVPEALQAPE